MAEDGDGVLDSGPVVLDISSDEEGESTDWISEFLNGDMDGGEDEDVVIVGVNPADPVKDLKGSVQRSKLKSGVCDDDEDECEILDGDPDGEKSVVTDSKNGSDDLLIVAEKGQIACRDYPHSRHLCVKFPFSSTLHDKHCDLCHCYVCDIPAPCVYWLSDGFDNGHCHATDKEDIWRQKRKMLKHGICSQKLQDRSSDSSVRLNQVPSRISSASRSVQIHSYLRVGGAQRTANHGRGPRHVRSVFKPNIISRCQRPSRMPQMITPRQMVPQGGRFVAGNFRSQINPRVKSATPSVLPSIVQMNGASNGSFHDGQPLMSKYDVSSSWHNLLTHLDLEIEALQDIPQQSNDSFTNIQTMPVRSLTQPLTDVNKLACESQPQAVEQCPLQSNLDDSCHLAENLSAPMLDTDQSMLDEVYGWTDMPSQTTSVNSAAGPPLSVYNASSGIAGLACSSSPLQGTGIDSESIDWAHSLIGEPGSGVPAADCMIPPMIYAPSSPLYDEYDSLWSG